MGSPGRVFVTHPGQNLPFFPGRLTPGGSRATCRFKSHGVVWGVQSGTGGRFRCGLRAPYYRLCLMGQPPCSRPFVGEVSGARAVGARNVPSGTFSAPIVFTHGAVATFPSDSRKGGGDVVGSESASRGFRPPCPTSFLFWWRVFFGLALTRARLVIPEGGVASPSHEFLEASWEEGCADPGIRNSM